MEEALQQRRRAQIAQQFLSGEWGVELVSFDAAFEAIASWLTDTSPRPLATERVSVHWVGREP